MSHPDFQFVTGVDRQMILAPGLRLSFLRDGDRWAHAVAVGAGDDTLLAGIASSVEGDPARDEPARVVSPAYQDVQPHSSEGNVCALLTGQSTPHHFSAVVTARRDGPSVSIAVDIADRCRSPVEVLAATYLVPLGSGDLIDAGPGRVVWGGDGLGQGRLEFTTAGGADAVAMAEAGRRATRVQALARLVPSTYTHRLFYSWRWTPAAGAGVVGP
jgi:hypothetical protein